MIRSPLLAKVWQSAAPAEIPSDDGKSILHVTEEWIVEAIDDDGAMEHTYFSGPDCEARAKEYAAAKYMDSDNA